jgi:hypothetical protein
MSNFKPQTFRRDFLSDGGLSLAGVSTVSAQANGASGGLLKTE